MGYKFLLLGLTLVLPSISADKKPPRLTFPTSRVFAASCQAVWPLALRSATRAGWGVQTSDRDGGIMTLAWSRGMWTGTTKSVAPYVKRYSTVEVSGFWHQWEGFRFVNATLLMTPEADRCSVSIDAVMHGYPVPAHNGWLVIPSSGAMEAEVLDGIEGALAGIK